MTVAKSPTEQIRELVTELRALAERDEYRRQEMERLTARADRRDDEIAALRQENALLRQQLHDHLKRVEVWSGRLWTPVTVLVGAVLALASGLITTLVNRK